MVNNSILLGKYVYDFLMQDVELQKRLNGNVFPLICDEDVKFPFIVYGRTSVVPSYVKDGLCEDTVNFVFNIVSNDYKESLEIANLVRGILECKRFSNEEVHVVQTRVEGVTESFEEGAYIQTIEISMVCGR